MYSCHFFFLRRIVGVTGKKGTLGARAFLLTGKTGENFPPDGTVEFFLQKRWNGKSCTI